MSMVLIFGGLMIGLLIFGTAYKYWEVRQANRWQRTPGKVLSAKSVARRVRTAETTSGAVAGADLQLRNFAEVTYEYRVGTRRFTGHRISLGEDPGDFQVAETLQRYPAGSQVTVYYNPDKPSQAVLEAGAPEGVWRTMIIFILVLIVLLVGTTVGFDHLVTWLQDRLARPQRVVPAAALGALALFMLLLGAALRRQLAEAALWPSVQGEVVSARVEQFASRERKMNQSGTDGTVDMHWRQYYRPDVEYRYKVGGIDYRGTRISFGGRLYASFEYLARQRTAAYQPGQSVRVSYDPKNPAQAVLELRSYGAWVVWLLAALFASGSAWLLLG